MRSQRSRFIAAALFTLAAAVANASSATVDVPSVEVSYGDLNLATPEGNRALYRRIVTAAEKVCPTTSAPGARFSSSHRTCVNEAIERAVSDSNSEQLAEVHAARARHVVRS